MDADEARHAPADLGLLGARAQDQLHGRLADGPLVVPPLRRRLHHPVRPANERARAARLLSHTVHRTRRYFYAIYFAVLLIHRAYRDDHFCAQKYGGDWAAYKKEVPYVFIPYLL